VREEGGRTCGSCKTEVAPLDALDCQVPVQIGGALQVFPQEEGAAASGIDWQRGPILGLIFSPVGRSLLRIYRTQYGRTPIRARMRCGPRPVSPDDYLTARRIDRETST